MNVGHRMFEQTLTGNITASPSDDKWYIRLSAFQLFSFFWGTLTRQLEVLLFVEHFILLVSMHKRPVYEIMFIILGTHYYCITLTLFAFTKLCHKKLENAT